MHKISFLLTKTYYFCIEIKQKQKMTFEQMNEGLKTIELMEKDLMRDLTKEEKEFILNNGWEEFLFNELGISNDDFKEMKYIRRLAGVYFTLRTIADLIDEAKPCQLQNDTEEYTNFMQDLYDNITSSDKSWFNKITEPIHENLFKIFKKEKEEASDKDLLCGTMTDAVKDNVIEDIANRLKKGEAIEMTNDEYLEVADYLCQNEDKIFLSNDNGTVRLTIL